MKIGLPLLLLGLFGFAVAEWEATRPALSADDTNLSTPLTARKTARMAMDDSQVVCPGDVSYLFSQNLFLDITFPPLSGEVTCVRLVRLTPVSFPEGGPYKITFANGDPAPTVLPNPIESSNVTNPVVTLGRGKTLVTVSPVSNSESSCTYAITIVDDEAPIVDGPSEVYAKTTAVMPDLRNLLSVEEACDFTVAQVPAPGSAIVGNPSSIPVNFTVTDASNNQTPAALTLYFQATTPYDNLGLAMPSVCSAFDLEATLSNLPTECFDIAFQFNGAPKQSVFFCTDNGTHNLRLGLSRPGSVPGTNTLTIISLAQDGQPTYFVNRTVTATVGLPILTTPTVAGAPVCAGQSVTLNFGVNCPDDGTFTAELSNASGSFAAPVSLGTVSAGSQSVVIPAGTPAGTGYRIRVLRPATDVTPAVSAPFQVNGPGVLALTTPTTPAKACQNQSLAVTFAATTTGACPFPESTPFTVQLSSAVGSFANPTVLGTAPAGTTDLPLPGGLPAGSGYRVRVVGGGLTSPVSLPFRIEGPSLSVMPTVSGAPVCRGQTVTVSFSLPEGSCPFPGGNVFTAQLSSAFGTFSNPTSLGPVVPGSNPVVIPATVAAGTGYRIRVVSNDPVLTSATSAPFRVNACASRLSAEEAELVVSPNPVSGREIRVRVSGMDSPIFSLTSPTGLGVMISVKTGPESSGGEFILTPRQALTPGVYAVQASEGNQRLTRRVLVAE